MKIVNNHFKQYTQLVSSNFVTIFLNFLLLKLFTMFMKIEDFGNYRTITNIFQLIQIVSAVGIPFTIAYIISNPKFNKQKISTFISIGNIILIKSVIVLSIPFILIYCIFCIYINKNFSIVWGLYYFYVYAVILQYYLDYVLMGCNDIKNISLKNLVTQIIQITLIILFNFLNLAISLSLALFIFSIGNLIYPIYLLRKYGVKLKVKKSEFNYVSNVNKKIGIPVYLGSLLSVASTYLVNLVVRNFSTGTMYASYALALMITMPLGTLISSLGNVFYKKFRAEKKLNNKFIILTLATSIFLLVTFNIFLMIIVPVLFGNEYIDAIAYAKIISVGSVLVGLGDVLNKFLASKGYSKSIRNAAFISGTTNIILAIILIPTFNLLGGAITLLGANIQYFIFLVFYYTRYLKSIK